LICDMYRRRGGNTLGTRVLRCQRRLLAGGREQVRILPDAL
jgi:hypothetical protein